MTVFIMHYWKSIRSLFFVLLFLVPVLSAQAASISTTRAEAELFDDGKLQVSTRFSVSLPSQLSEALQQGIALNFRLEFDLERPRMTAFKLRLDNWFEATSVINYKLSYHQLTQRYRVSIGSLSVNYGSLDSALRAIGGISGWQVLPPRTLSGLGPESVSAKVRLLLDLGDLPKPFQLNAFGSSDWSLASAWTSLTVKAHN